MPSISVLDSTGTTQTVQTLPAVGQAAMAASLPVVLASNQTAIPVTNTPAATTTSTLNSAATTNATSVKGTAGTLYSITASNIGAAIVYLKLYNKASAPTVGTDTPVLTIPIPLTGIVNLPFGELGILFSTGIALAITNLAADTDTTVIVASQVKVITSYI